MIKKNLLILLSITCLGLTACAPSSIQNIKVAETPNPSETAETGGRADKVPDPNAPVLTIVSIYPVNKEKTGLYQEMEGLDAKEPQLLIDKMIEYSILEEGTTVNSFTQNGTTATLDLNKLDTTNKFVLPSLVNSFTENFELDKLSITVNGQSDPKLNNLEYTKNYKDIP